jgi:hypothetical protein
MLVIVGVSNTVNCFILSCFSIISPLEAEVSNDISIIQVLNKNTSLLNSQFPTLGKISASLLFLSESFIFTDSIISSVYAVIFAVSQTISQVSGSTVTLTFADEFGEVVKYIFSEAHKAVTQSISNTSIFKECLHTLTSFIT